MSLNTKLAAAKELVSVFKRWPDDSNKIYKSFRSAQIALYDQSTASALPPVSVETYRARAAGASAIADEVNFRKFAASDKLMHPDGKPEYYRIIVREANREDKKVGFLTAIRESVFGWYK